MKPLERKPLHGAMEDNVAVTGDLLSSLDVSSLDVDTAIGPVENLILVPNQSLHLKSLL